jgi:hypothetical protein
MTPLERGLLGRDFASTWRLYSHSLLVGGVVVGVAAWMIGFEQSILVMPLVAAIVITSQYFLMRRAKRRIRHSRSRWPYLYDAIASWLAFRAYGAIYPSLYYTSEMGRILFHLQATTASSLRDLEERKRLNSLVRRWLYYKVGLESVVFAAGLAIISYVMTRAYGTVDGTQSLLRSLIMHESWLLLILPVIMLGAVFLLRELEHIVGGLGAILKSVQGKYDVRVVKSELSHR